MRPIQAPSFCKLTLIILISTVPFSQLDAEDDERLAFFESRIRPVLIKHCYECHAADSEENGGGLRVDSAVGIFRGGDSGPAIVKGDADNSPLIEAIRYDGVEMPPDGRLPKNVIEDFEKWVESGAHDPRDKEPAANAHPPKRTIDIEEGKKFWSFQPVKRSETPAVKQSEWVQSEIDAFVLAKLEENQLPPAPAADRRTLVRRLYFDLIGLPPTPEQMRAVLDDESPDAIKKLVDQLLASPQFGVHWGRHWLDVARYADSNGGDFNATFHNAWKYRNYVIAAYNDDKPFDQFVREQIAGDLLARELDGDLSDDAVIKEKSEKIIATGFLMIGAKMLSERDKVKLTMDVVDEQLNTIGQAFMGMTLGCARCHDHKFDPIPTSDYYAMAGMFRSTRTLQGESQEYVSTWPRRVLPASPELIAATKKYEADKKRQAELVKQQKKVRDEMKLAVASLAVGDALVVDNTQAKLTGVWQESTYSRPFFGAGYIHDNKSEKGEKFAEFSFNVPVDGKYDVQISYTASGNRDANVPISIKHADAEIEVKANQQKKPPIDNLFASIGEFRFESEKPGLVTFSTRDTTNYVIVDAVRLVQAKTSEDSNDSAKKAEQQESDALVVARKELEAVEVELKQLEADLKSLNENAPAPLEKAIAVEEAEKIDDCEICIRGEHDNLGAKTPRGVLQVALNDEFPTINENESGRLQLANWMADPRHPLTARVYVNRVWHYLIGQGIVPSLDNFGSLGDRPSHPELLDRLAADFVENGWSTKWLIRQIVTSCTYQISSRHDEAAWNADPGNHLLWRANRKRIPAESIRDSILQISGKLELDPAGSPVKGLGTLVTQNTSEAKEFENSESMKRSTYLPIIRSELPAILLTFDFADPDLVTGRRSITNVPAQALFLLNSPFVMEHAGLAAVAVREKYGVDSKLPAKDIQASLIRQSYELVLSREPTSQEVIRATAFMNSINDPTDNKAGEESENDPLARVVHTLMSSTEFRILE